MVDWSKYSNNCITSNGKLTIGRDMNYVAKAADLYTALLQALCSQEGV